MRTRIANCSSAGFVGRAVLASKPVRVCVGSISHLRRHGDCESMASARAAVTLMGGKPLPNCRDAPHGVWHWIDPTGPTRPLTVDGSGNWNHGQLIAPPAVAAAQPAWLEALRSWREGCIGPLGLDESPVIFDDPQLTWTQTSFVHVQMHPFDRLFYDEASGSYTVRRWLDDLRERFGGVDAALLWPTYPMLGIDDRNAYDMIRSLPGGIDALRGVVRELHEEGVRVLWPLMPWDTATRYEGPEPEAMLRLLNQTGADGINGDTLYAVPEAFYKGGASDGTHAALQAELGGELHGLRWSTLGWGESGGWSRDLGASRWHAPQVDRPPLVLDTTDY